MDGSMQWIAGIINNIVYSDTYFVDKRPILNLISDTGCRDKYGKQLINVIKRWHVQS